MSKRKHPADRAERLRINEEKEGRKVKAVKGISKRPSDPLPEHE